MSIKALEPTGMRLLATRGRRLRRRLSAEALYAPMTPSRATTNPSLVLVKHAMPILDSSAPPRHWLLGEEGEGQARAIGSALKEFSPEQIDTSPEPKALRTAELISQTLSVPMRSHPGLVEFSRPALPLVGDEEHARLNRQLFDERTRPVIGAESADDALRRFEATITEIVAGRSAGDVIAVTHGTVISLFAASHNDVDAFELWGRPKCGSAVMFRLPGFELLDVLDLVGGAYNSA